MDGASMMSRGYDLRPAKKVFLYRNGATDTEPKCMVVNDRQIRDFSTFLNRATSGLRAPVAIRNIYTPAGGHKVKTLDGLESGRYYVAGGSEHFKKVKYGSEGRRLLVRRRKTELVLPHRSPGHAVIASSRYKRPIEKPFVIHVFRNGDERYRGARILIPRRMMGSWEYVLEVVTEKTALITPAKRLCTLDGRLLHAVSELQDGGKYVALEGTRVFQKVSYSAIEEKRSPLRAAATLPKTIRRLKKLPPRPRGAKQSHLGVEAVESPEPTAAMKHKERKSRPFGGRKNKQGREKAVEDHRADSIFGGSPVRPASPAEPLDPAQVSPLAATTHQAPKTLDTPMEAQPQTSSPTTKELVTEDEVVEDLNTSVPVEEVLEESTHEDNDEPAKAPHDDTGDVEEVLEGGETEGDKSIKAVEETEEVDEGQNYGKANEQEIKELESQPLQNSVDLSVLRNKQLPSDADNSQDKTSSKRSSAKSTASSRKPSATKTTSRPQSVDKVDSSQTHSVLNISRPGSKPSVEEQVKEQTPPPAEVLEEDSVQDDSKVEPTEADQVEPVEADPAPPVPVETKDTSEESVEPTTESVETKQADIPDDHTETQDDTPEEAIDVEEPTEPETAFVVENTET